MTADPHGIRPLLHQLAARFGELICARTKPFSVHYRDPANAIMVKIYRVITPQARQNRELEALSKAPTFGLRVPQVVDHGVHGGVAWTAIKIVPGTPLRIRGAAEAQVFVTRAQSLMQRLHAHTAPGSADHGWSSRATILRPASDFLTSQLSSRIRSLPSWQRLRDQLRILDDLPVVHLHGDVKPEHLIAEDDVLFMVDWEACSRGPAVVDDADITFRVARDLVYADRPVENIIAVLPNSAEHAAALAWRLALWLDRRHSEVSKEVGALVDDLMALAISIGECRPRVRGR